jgi:hypothetical protein
MNNQNLTLTISVDQSPEEVFAAVMNVRGWWSEALEGRSAAVGDEFTYRYEAVHRSTHRVIEAIPGKSVAWLTLEAELTHARNPAEWTGTEVRFDIAREGDTTELRFTHVGLTPDNDCFEACSRGWGHYVGDSLRRLITTGTGKPYAPSKSRENAA